MKFLLTSIFAVLLAANVVLSRPRSVDNQSDIPAEEYALYAVVIDQIFAGDRDSQGIVKTLVIVDRTISNPLPSIAGVDEDEMVKRQFSSISQEAIDDYAAKKANPCQLTKSFNLKMKYTLTSKEKIEQVFKNGQDGWGEFYKLFPDSGGVTELSRAGLNSSGNQALVYIQHSCGYLCGSGYYLLLVKNDLGWVVQKKFMAWVS